MNLKLRLARVTVSVLVALLVGLGGIASASAESFEQVNNLLSAWEMDAAQKAIGKLAKVKGDDPNVLYLQARYDFFQGDYEEAVQKLDQAIANGGDLAHFTHLRDLIKSTHEVTKDYVKYTSSKGRFEIFVPKGRDQVLVPFAAEALERAYEEVGDELGFKPATPIRVEVYPRTATLAKVSSLTEQEIRTSGTIALCKYNRLMITSPRALLRGYGWVDTLVHEYVHYVINTKTKNRVPIWMHEGLAKFLERRWRGAHAHKLNPSSQNLLKKRVESDNLITFEQMHPSMAKLPSQEDAAVAFAQVYTVMEYLRGQVGEKAFGTLLDNINKGMDAKTAFATTVGKPFADFEKDWLAHLKTREMADLPEDSGYEEKLLFKEENAQKSEVNEIEQPEARDHMHLGEMLQARNRHGAALVQYKKASHLLGKTNPVLHTRQAQCLLHENKAKEALEVLEPVKETYPSYVQAWIEMGKASLALGQYEDAREYLSEAARINPFDPEVHEKLAEAYEKLGDAEMAKKYRKFAKLVS
ncbi:tetratricopeptide repeat protein [Persicimonas caeni]|uniref:Tetratricopeptide repeat protein n=1 Tax=Persicimonas caeni TaxID=2292766 RepID=A0A4Y6PRL1_PERCE|nr:tetratricopeptide repeat protein [Persicimonas caeni]QDG50863.1 tetratricopeptide repeat protein [Persicimonas caeni]QED32084.1 tetratricopeptide repeat protein [Persicimonas caeni]